MIKDLDIVVLDVDLPKHGLEKGDMGTVVYVHNDTDFIVEFMTIMGKTVAVVPLRADQIRLPNSREVKHARPVA